MTEENTRPEQTEDEIRIDYDNIDVTDIMAQIKKKIAARPDIPQEEDMADEPVPPLPPEIPEMLLDPSGTMSKKKRLLLKLMKPFTPIIKLLIFPVWNELAETVIKLDFAGRKLNYLTQKLDYELGILTDSMNRRMDRTEKSIEVLDNTVNERVNIAFDEIGRIQEYTKLLHSLSHNLVVELTKLKIEEETLKVKTRVMEKDFEFLEKREKAIEKEVFK
jgi:hypothetical protein